MSDVFRMWFFVVQLVGQEGQAPPGGFVSDFVHHILQGVDVLPNVLQHKTQAVSTAETLTDSTKRCHHQPRQTCGYEGILMTTIKIYKYI